MALPNNPQTRKEMYLSNMAGQGTALPSEPHTREEEYLDYIAKNGGGGGTGEGDMTKAVYDDDLAVASAGGIADYVAGAITGKVDKVQGKGLSTNDYDDSAKAIVDNVTTDLDAKQPKTLSEPIYVDGIAKFSVETAIDAVNGLAASNKSALLTKADTSQIAAIQDGQNIDSFGDVETALASKSDLTNLANEFSTSYNYVKGQYVTYNGKMYRFKSDHSAGAWSIGQVEEAKVSGELSYKENEMTFNSSDFNIIQSTHIDPDYNSKYVNLNKDTTPEYNSSHPITSGGVYAALQDKASKSNVIANTKLIKDTVGWSGKNKCETIPSFTLVKGSERTKNNTIKDTPNYGTYKVSFTISNAANITKQGGIQIGDSAGNWSVSADGVFDVVNGRVLLTIPFAHAVSRVYVFLNGNDGDTATATFSDFMITDADILDDTYEPYFGSTAFPRSEQAVLGAYNIVQNNMVNHSKNDVTFTVASDKIITLSGTSSGDISVGDDNGTIGSVKDLPLGKYKLVGCPTGGSGSTYRLVISNTAGTAWITDFGDGIEFELTSGHTWDKLYIRANSGVNLTGKIFKPMITTDLNATYADYVPFAMTNKELTEKVASRVIFKTLSGGDLDDILTTGWYSWGGTAPAHSPQGVAYSCMQCIVETGVQKQIVYFGADVIYMRQRSGSPATWGSWYKFQGTVVS